MKINTELYALIMNFEMIFPKIHYCIFLWKEAGRVLCLEFFAAYGSLFQVWFVHPNK